MPKTNLTARTLEALKPLARGQVDYWDASLPGFGVRVSPGGRKAWVLMYRIGSRKRRLTLGTYPPMMLADARDEAKAALLTVQKGSDPAAEKFEWRKAQTFAQLAELYLEKHAKPNKKSWRLDEKALWRDVVPRLGNRRAREITRRDIRDLLDDIKARGSPIQANRTFEIMRKLFNWAIAEDYLPDSPCQKISKPAKENRRDRVLKEDEIRAVWQAMEAEQPLVAALFKLRLITAQRGGEVASMRWEDIDFPSSWWTIPGERTKNGLSHRVPLSPLALEILDRLKTERLEPPWIFPSPKPGRHLEHMVQATRRIRKRSGIEFVPHDLRRTAASYMTGMGMPRLTVKKILNHVESDVNATYDRHSYDQEKRQALEAWGQRLEEIVSGRAVAAVGNVVELPGARR